MANEKTYLTVTALTKYIRYKFDNDVHLANVLLEGEISNFKKHSRGHFYFTLKDQGAQISATMFYSDARHVQFEPKDGMKVLVKGRIFENQLFFRQLCWDCFHEELEKEKIDITMPSVKIKRGFVSPDSKYNSVGYNVMVIKGSKMPDVKNGNLILAAHRGNSSVSFFDKLYKTKRRWFL